MHGKNSPSDGRYTRWLALLSLVLLLSNIHWISNQKPVYWDEAGHAKTVLEIKDAFTSGLLKHGPAYALGRFYEATSYVYPPLYYITAQPVSLLFPSSESALRLLNTGYYILLLWLTFHLGGMLYDKKTALLSAFILSMYPIIYGLSRYIMLDLLMACLLVINVIFLLKSDYFQNRRYSLLYGLSFGLGMLSKSLFVTFAIAPLLYKTAEEMLKGKAAGKTEVHRNLLYALLTATAISCVWYLPNLPTFIQNSLNVGSHDLFGLGPVYSLRSLLFYPLALINHQMSFFFTLLLAVSLAYSKKDGKYRLTASAIIIPLAIHTALSHKVAHQTIGILPFAALLSAGFITSRKRLTATALASAVLIVGAAQYADVSFGIGPLKETTVGGIAGYPVSVWRNEYYYCTHPPRNEDWKIENMLKDMDRTNPNAGEILVLTKKDSFNWLAFSYEDYKRGRDRKINGEGIIDRMGDFMDGTYDAGKNDFIVLDNETYEKTKNTILEGFRPEGYYTLPDGSVQILIQKY